MAINEPLNSDLKAVKRGAILSFLRKLPGRSLESYGIIGGHLGLAVFDETHHPHQFTINLENIVDDCLADKSIPEPEPMKWVSF